MTQADEQASIIELVEHIQYTAYLASGVDPATLPALHREQARRLKKFQETNPTYLPSKQEILAGDARLTFLELDLSERARRETPTRYQDPLLYAWLADSWEHHRLKLYKNEDIRGRPLVLATAPTGEFNAIAIPSHDGYAILLEEGLVNFARKMCKLVAPVLYRRRGDVYERTSVEHVVAACFEDRDRIDEISSTIIEYVVHGSIPSPTPASPVFDPAGDISNVIFSGFVSFVFEHELHHIVRHASDAASEPAPDGEADFVTLWRELEEKVLPHLSDPPSEQTVRRRFFDHREELHADMRAMNRLVLIGRMDKTEWATIDGGALFFHLIDSFREAFYLCVQPEVVESQKSMGGRQLSITALLTGASHPYPLVRRSGVLAHARKNSPSYGELMIQEDHRMALLFRTVRARIAALLALSPPVAVHPKWRNDFSSLV